MKRLQVPSSSRDTAPQPAHHPTKISQCPRRLCTELGPSGLAASSGPTPNSLCVLTTAVRGRCIMF